MLRVRNLSVRYDEVWAVNGLSFAVKRGEAVALIGSNGAGKSSTLKAISRMLPYGGEVVFEGQDLSLVQPHQVVDLGIIQVPEGRRLFYDMSVMDNLLVGGYCSRAHELREETLGEVFSLLPLLKERKNQLARTLSGGEQQMLAIARGLMARPKLLMLDEPSLGLAPVMVEQVFDIVRNVRDKGATLLLVEQNVTKSLELSNKAYVIENSRLVLEGPSREIIKNPHVKEAYLGM